MFAGLCFGMICCAVDVWPGELSPLDRTLVTFEQIASPNYGKFTSISRDDRGFLWFGTTSGLCKYDGYTLRPVLIGTGVGDHLLQEKQNVIRGLMRMRNGSLLAATNAGLWVVDPRTEQSEPLPGVPELSDQMMNALAEDQRGVIWIGTHLQGLYAYEPGGGTVKRFTMPHGLSNDQITCLLVDHTGGVWIGTIDGGLNHFDPATSQFTSYRTGEKVLSDHITSLAEYRDREIWIGTNEGLYVLDHATRRIRQVDLHTSGKYTVTAIVGDPAGGVWVGVQELGLLFALGDSVTRCSPVNDVERSLSTVLCLTLDTAASAGTSFVLWAGTRSGVDKLAVSKNPFTNHIRGEKNLALDRGAVLASCEDSKGVLWTGLWGGGVNGFQRVNGSYRRVARFAKGADSPIALPNNDITSLFEDRRGNLWIGSMQGLAKLDGSRTTLATYRHAEGDSTSIADDGINRIYEDRSGTIWICTNGGLSSRGFESTSRFRQYLNDPADAHPVGGNRVTDIVEDRDGGRYWVGTLGRGLLRLDTSGSVTQFLVPGDSSRTLTNWIADITEAPDGRLWLTTRGGMVSFDRSTGTFTRWELEALGDSPFFDIRQDARGDLWLATSIGLLRFNPTTRAVVRYQSEDGFPFAELFSGFSTTARGTLIVGGIDGFTEFFPEAVGRASRPPGIAITEFAVFDKPLTPAALATGDIRLAHDENFFSLSFAAFDYANPLRNRFAYRMEGVDDRWSDAGNRNYVRYTHLDPGSYVFRVKGCNSENVWNEAGASVLITITPPFWQMWWFRLLVIAILGGTATAGYRYRVRRVIEVERMRLRIADDLHDDVGSNLSAIAMASRAVQHAPELPGATRQKLAEIYSTAVATSDGMKDIVWFIKPRNDTLDDLLLRMKDTASFLLADVKHDFQESQIERSVKLTLDFKRHFYLGFKEILANIVKHAGATSVVIHVAQRDGRLEMVVRDDGCGFEPPPPGVHLRGNGLTSLRNRAESLGGELELLSEPGKGTTVKFCGRL